MKLIRMGILAFIIYLALHNTAISNKCINIIDSIKDEVVQSNEYVQMKNTLLK